MLDTLGKYQNPLTMGYAHTHRPTETSQATYSHAYEPNIFPTRLTHAVHTFESHPRLALRTAAAPLRARP